MKLKMLTSLQGPRLSLVKDAPYECGDEEGQRLIDAGFAERDDAAEQAAAEKAAAEKTEQSGTQKPAASKSNAKSTKKD